ncbi:MAG: SDR family oxidoreductase [Desulfobacteraceae bacterium]|nr:MAG: SDR family oxidoreductase [Desulfobacteraceae bacterium]
MYSDLDGKVALISGSGRKAGIGFAIAEKLAGNGVHICFADLRGQLKEMEMLAEELRRMYSVNTMCVELDVTSVSSIDGAVESVRERFGGLDILVNNAGTVFGAPSSVVKYDDEAWINTIDVNLHGVFRVSKKFYPDLEKRRGCIVNTASTAGKGPHAYAGAYSCSKTAVIMLTKVMATETAQFGVRVNAVCPGLVMTDLMKLRFQLEAKAHGGTPAEQEDRLRMTVPLQRIASPSEVAALVAFLASEEASYITGQAINVCGGRTMAL